MMVDERQGPEGPDRVSRLGRRPRVLIVTRSTVLHPGAGGMEKVSWALARRLAEHYDVVVLTTPTPDLTSGATVDGVEVRTVRFGRPGRYGPAWWVQTGLCPDPGRADVVLSVSAGATAMLWRPMLWRPMLGRGVVRRRSPAFVFQAHGTAYAQVRATLRGRPRLWPLKALRSAAWVLLDSASYRRVDVVVAAGERVRAELERPIYRRAWTRTRLLVVPNGVAAPRPRAAQDTGRRGIVVVTVSRLTRQKGVDRVIAALGHAAADVRLLVLGDGDQSGALRAQVAELQLADRVQFHGAVDDRAVAEVLSAADVFVFPVREAEREGLPLAVLEALAADLPVLVPPDSAWPADLEAVVDRVDMDDPVALAAAIGDRSGAAGRAGVLPAHYTQDAMNDAYRTLVDGLVAGRGRPEA